MFKDFVDQGFGGSSNEQLLLRVSHAVSIVCWLELQLSLKA